jgi:hypothetical protein
VRRHKSILCLCTARRAHQQADLALGALAWLRATS